VDSLNWDHGDGTNSTASALTHTHTYTRAGVYTVTLSVSDGVMSDTLTRTNYITATGGTVYTTTTRVITYAYECAASLKRSERDKLYRLTDADYRAAGLTAGSSGESSAYACDPVGNPVSAYASRCASSSGAEKILLFAKNALDLHLGRWRGMPTGIIVYGCSGLQVWWQLGADRAGL
jgi:PKD repeat protein